MISVIVPVYKVEKYLKRCIDSIINQTYTDLEIILVDDASPDNCGRICDEYAKKDSRIVVIHKENGGVSSARNAGLDIAKGAYVGFVDADDWIAPNMYEEMIKNAVDNEADCVMCGYKVVFDDNSKSYDVSPEDKGLVGRIEGLKQLLMATKTNTGYNGYVWNKIILKEKINERFADDIAVGEDCIFMVNVLFNCDRIYLNPEPFCFYYQRRGSACHQTNKITKQKLDNITSREIIIKRVAQYKFLVNRVKKELFGVGVGIMAEAYILGNKELAKQIRERIKDGFIHYWFSKRPTYKRKAYSSLLYMFVLLGFSRKIVGELLKLGKRTI